jgi:hypothetical protein
MLIEPACFLSFQKLIACNSSPLANGARVNQVEIQGSICKIESNGDTRLSWNGAVNISDLLRYQ